ncbi:MAG: SprT family zinc-dependent metalloprotease [Rickettsiales bacterium]
MKNIAYNNQIIKLDDLEVKVKVCNRSTRTKIRITSIVELILPKRASFKQAYEFLLSKELWIRNSTRKLNLPENKKDKIISILGKEYFIVLNDPSINEPIKFTEDKLIISSAIAKDKINIIITFYLKKLIRDEIESYASIKAAELGVKFNRISIRDTISRWGSCSSNGNLSFSWKLALSPRNVMEYVVAHELCHLIEMNHSKRFWNLVESIFPNFLAARSWLKIYGKTLHGISFN